MLDSFSVIALTQKKVLGHTYGTAAIYISEKILYLLVVNDTVSDFVCA